MRTCFFADVSLFALHGNQEELGSPLCFHGCSSGVHWAPHHKYGTDGTEGATPMHFQCCLEDADGQPGLELVS